jgi:acylphosphatase
MKRTEDEVSFRRAHFRVTGSVQGVGYRYFTFRHARRLALKGWVRNMSDGRVEVLAEGPSDVIQNLAGLLADGPRGSKVTEVDLEWKPWSGEFEDFRISR